MRIGLQMPEVALQRRFRLLLSWREKAHRLEREALSAQQGEQPQQQKRLASYYEAHLREANHHLVELRQAEQAGLEQKAAALRAAIARQQAFRDSGIADERAAAVAQELEQIRAQIALYNKMLVAESPNDLGGFIDLPIEEYAVAAGYRNIHTPMVVKMPSTTRRVVIFAVVASVIGIIGVLYWTLWSREVHFQVIPPHSEGAVVIRCTNGKASPVEIALPLPGAQESSQDYYVEVLAKRDGEDEFHALPVPQEAWRVDGAPLPPDQELQVLPGLQADIMLETAQLKAQDEEITALRIICRAASGTGLAEGRVAL